jgi:chromosome segregation ATPase
VLSEYQIFALIEKLEHKIKLLRSTCDNAQKQVKELRKSNADLRKHLQEKENELNELRKKQDNPEKNPPKSKDVGIIVEDNLSETDTNAELKQQLDEYIREVERCIAHLSSLS